jgi:hypothetical protein
VSPNPDAGGDTVCGAGGYTQDDCLTDDDCATGFCDPISKQCKIYEPGGASCTNVGACCDEGNICVDFGGVLSCQRSNSCDSQSDHGTSAIPLPGYSGPKLTIEQILGAVSGLLFPIGLALGLFFIVKAGYTYMTSQGNPEMTKKAQEDLTAAIVGIVFILLSVTILRVIMKSVIGI